MSGETEPLFDLQDEKAEPIEPRMTAETVLGEQTVIPDDPYTEYEDTTEVPPTPEEEEEIIVAYTQEAYAIFRAMHIALQENSEAK